MSRWINSALRALRALLRSALRILTVVLVSLIIIALCALWWGRAAVEDLIRTSAADANRITYATLRGLEYFRIRKITVRGLRIVETDSVIQRLHLRSQESIWLPLRPLRFTLEALPGVESVRVDRRLPDELVISVRESPPIAWLADAPRPTLITRSGALVTAISDSAEWHHLPRIHASDHRALEPRMLDALHSLNASGLPWLSDVRQVDALPGGDLRVALEGGTTVLLPPGATPLTASLVGAIARKTPEGPANLTVDLRFDNLVVTRPN